MEKEINLIDRGRGLQLSTSRITVLDLIPYFRRGCSYEEIRRWLPTLSAEEIAVVEAHYRAHQAEWDEKDRQAREYREEQIRQQRLRFPEPQETNEERMARLKAVLQQKRGEANGEGTSRGR